MVFVVSIWPVLDSEEKRREIHKILEDCGTVREKVETKLTRLGLRNFLLQIYGEQKWTGNLRNRFKHLDKYLDIRYKENSSLLTYVCEFGSRDDLTAAEGQIRSICESEEDTFYVSGDSQKTELILELLENEHNFMLMNYYEPDLYRMFTKNLSKMKKFGAACGISPRDYLIVSDAVLALFNIEPFAQISWIPIGKEDGKLNKLNRREYEGILGDWQEEIYKPENQVTFLGFRFISLDMLRKMNIEKKGHF